MKDEEKYEEIIQAWLCENYNNEWSDTKQSNEICDYWINIIRERERKMVNKRNQLIEKIARLKFSSDEKYPTIKQYINGERGRESHNDAIDQVLSIIKGEHE